MFLLTFVKGSKSEERGRNPLADLDPGGPDPLADMERGSISASGFGRGEPNPLGHLAGGSFAIDEQGRVSF